MRHNVQTLMETDWRAEAVALLEKRMKEKERGEKPYVSCVEYLASTSSSRSFQTDIRNLIADNRKNL